MNRQECAELLTVATAYDHRTLGEVDVIAWHEAIGDLALDECKQAVVQHYKTSTEWLMPVNIRRLVSVTRQDRAMRALPRGREDLIPMPDWFRTTVAEHRRRAQAGRKMAADNGEPVTFGSAIVKAIDSMPQNRTPR